VPGKYIAGAALDSPALDQPVQCVKAEIYRTTIFYVGFEVFTAVVMKSIILWDMRPCSPLSSNRRFGGTYRLHLQGGDVFL
jgi:hypothetical protein